MRALGDSVSYKVLYKHQVLLLFKVSPLPVSTQGSLRSSIVPITPTRTLHTPSSLLDLNQRPPVLSSSCIRSGALQDPSIPALSRDYLCLACPSQSKSLKKATLTSPTHSKGSKNVCRIKYLRSFVNLSNQRFLGHLFESFTKCRNNETTLNTVLRREKKLPRIPPLYINTYIHFCLSFSSLCFSARVVYIAANAAWV